MLDELRQKSSSTRQTYAFWGALTVTGVVALGWAASLTIRFSEVAADVDGADQTANSLSEFFGDIKDEAGAALASSSLPTTNKDTWGLNLNATTTNSDPILIATTTVPAKPSHTIQIATSSTPNR